MLLYTPVLEPLPFSQKIARPDLTSLSGLYSTIVCVKIVKYSSIHRLQKTVMVLIQLCCADAICVQSTSPLFLLEKQSFDKRGILCGQYCFSQS